MAQGGESPLESLLKHRTKGLHVAQKSLPVGNPTKLLRDYRGGTSRLFFLEGDLPKGQTRRDTISLEAFDVPDVRQIDGFGERTRSRARAHTSMRRSGPFFALLRDLIKPEEPITKVRERSY